MAYGWANAEIAGYGDGNVTVGLGVYCMFLSRLAGVY
jgi:hypothetical protein